MKYSWIPDVLDFRDLKFTPKAEILNVLPAKVDLRSKFSIVYNQGELGSCTANAIVLGFDFTRIKEGLPPIFSSRLFLYYNERDMEGTTGEDSGAMIRDGMKSLSNIGVCTEKLWDYNLLSFTKKPPNVCYTEAQNHKVEQYNRLDNSNLSELKSCLAEEFTFVFGFAVYSSFESDVVAKTGKVPYPSKLEKLLGGHAVLAVGYDDDIQCFIVRNSWGIGWGDKGHFYMPYSYITNINLADDFWTIKVN